MRSSVTAAAPPSPERDPERVDLRIERVEFGHPDAVRLIGEVQQEYVVRYGGMDETPLDPVMFDPPRGSFYVGYVDDKPMVSGAWRRREDVEALGSTHTAEIKRMYVAPDGRGRGLARAMLATLEATAREAMAEVAILETGTAQPEAIALYLSSGYVEVPKFGFYCHAPESRCFGKVLTGDVPRST
jgi:ribosomal protein S18 acetylase RimI-like enzyme